VGFMVDRVALGQDFVHVFRSPPVSVIAPLLRNLVSVYIFFFWRGHPVVYYQICKIQYIMHRQYTT